MLSLGNYNNAVSIDGKEAVMGFENTCRECDKPIGWHKQLCQQCKTVAKMDAMAEKARYCIDLKG